MKWNVVTDPTLKRLFGESLETVYRGVHLVMTSNWQTVGIKNSQYIVQESKSRKVVACSKRKGDCYKELKLNFQPSKRA